MAHHHTVSRSPEPLHTCPGCRKHGFTARGLRAHVCKGRFPGMNGQKPRRLTAEEVATATTKPAQ